MRLFHLRELPGYCCTKIGVQCNSKKIWEVSQYSCLPSHKQSSAWLFFLSFSQWITSLLLNKITELFSCIITSCSSKEYKETEKMQCSRPCNWIDFSMKSFFAKTDSFWCYIETSEPLKIFFLSLKCIMALIVCIYFNNILIYEQILLCKTCINYWTIYTHRV